MKKATTDKKQIAYGRLKEFILDYRVEPGQRLEHEYLSKLIGVSYTPIREALNQLLEEGYVYQIQNRGYFVSKLSSEEIVELYELREALEVYALKKVLTQAQIINKMILHNLKEMFNKYADSAREGTFRKRLFLDQEIHMTLAKLSGNHRLVKSLGDIFERVNYKRRVVGLYPERGPEASAEHFGIYKHIRQKNIEQALSCLSDHIVKGKEKLLELLKDREENLKYYHEREQISLV